MQVMSENGTKLLGGGYVNRTTNVSDHKVAVAGFRLEMVLERLRFWILEDSSTGENIIVKEWGLVECKLV